MMDDKKGVRRQKSRQEEYEMPRRGENIYKRGDGRWEGRYIRGRTPEGRAQYGYVYAATYSVCREKRRQRLRELPREITPSNNMTLPEAVELFFVEREQKRKLKESTVSRYRYVVRQYSGIVCQDFIAKPCGITVGQFLPDAVQEGVCIVVEDIIVPYEGHLAKNTYSYLTSVLSQYTTNRCRPPEA